MEPSQKPLSELVTLYHWSMLKETWNQVQQRWYTIYEHWYPLLTDEWPAEILVIEAEWFYAEVPLPTLRSLLKSRGIEWIWEFRGEEAPASFRLAPDLFVPCYTGDEGYWTAEGYDWLIYASQESSLTFAGTWLVQAVKACWPNWEQHAWRESGYIRPSQMMTLRPRGAFPGYERLQYDARLLTRAERTSVWDRVKKRWQIPDSWAWYPIIGEPGHLSHVICLQEQWFSFAISPERLAELLKQRGMKRVWGIKEGVGTIWEVESELIEPWYEMDECYWTSEELDWLLYVSHESSVTIAGEWFVDAVKNIWPEWEQHVWQSYAYEPPPQQTTPSSWAGVPRSF